jgi:hypothetical protein
MWLINCQTLDLEYVVDHQDTKYAILSHTWETAEEVQFEEFQTGKATEKRGWQKIRKVCQLALKDGCSFAWVDTCCINKTSSAELTEAINSMFPWYGSAQICYAYLADYDSSDLPTRQIESRWFTRGWTLQELIAPAQVNFYDKSWEFIGTKATLSQDISQITGISQGILLASEDQLLQETLDEVPIAQRMSWAAKRETTRTEDLAYCLLGIFGINLPLLYGEGMRAFLRLQEEVVKNSNDLSLLAWQSPYDPDRKYCGVFAEHPRLFQVSSRISLVNDVKFLPDSVMTNKGLKMYTALSFDHSVDLHVLEINCYDTANQEKQLAIYLKHQGASVFARAKPHRFALGRDINAKVENKSLFLTESMTSRVALRLNRVQRGSFVVPVYGREIFVAAKPELLWDSTHQIFITGGLKDFVGCHEYSVVQRPRRNNHVEGFFVLFGYGYGCDPWVRVQQSTELLSIDIQCGDWRKIALDMAKTTHKSLRIVSGSNGKNYWSIDIGATIESSTRGNEPVYLVRCHA